MNTVPWGQAAFKLKTDAEAPQLQPYSLASTHYYRGEGKNLFCFYLVCRIVNIGPKNVYSKVKVKFKKACFFFGTNFLYNKK